MVVSKLLATLLCVNRDLLELLDTGDVRHITQQYERGDCPFTATRVATTLNFYRPGLLFKPRPAAFDSFPVDFLAVNSGVSSCGGIRFVRRSYKRRIRLLRILRHVTCYLPVTIFSM